MKKTILTSAILLTALAGAFAQSSDTQLQVVLQSVQTIEVANKPVVLTYASKDDYVKGVTSREVDHLTVFSTGGFAITVKAKGDLVGDEGQTIASNGITVALPSAPSALLAPTGLPLTSSFQTFFKSKIGESDKKYTVIYKGAGDSKYINNFKKEGPTNIYETTVTYSIEAI